MLGTEPCTVHLALVNLELTFETPGTGTVTTALDVAGIDLEPQGARARCIAESAERLIGLAPAVLADQSTPQPQPGTTVLPWQLFAPYDASTLAALDAGLAGRPQRWFRAHGVVSGEPYSAPASKVHLGWPLRVDAGDDGECDASGTAAGSCDEIDRPRLHGLLEVLERDALMLAWRLPSWPVARLDRAILGEVILRFADNAGLSLTVREIGDPRLLPVALCLLSNRSGGVVCASACNPDLAMACQRAALEAIMLWYGLVHDEAKVRPPDRVSRSRDHVAWAWCHGDTVRQWFAALPQREVPDLDSSLEAVARRCRSTFFGAEPVVVDLADPTAIGVGRTYVCRVLQPGALRKEWTATRPFLGGPRLVDLTQVGTSVNTLPHPYG